MKPRQRLYIQLDGTGRPVSSSLVMRTTKPSMGTWIEILTENETTITTSTTAVPLTTTTSTTTTTPLVGYFISPTGSDTTGTGTINNPWFSLNKAWSSLSAGSTLYLRGGTYAFNTQQYLSGKNGTALNKINILAYPNETPILTKGNSYPATSGIYFKGDYFNWKGITITGFTQPNGGVNSHGMRVENSNYNTFENLNVYNNGIGMAIFTSTSDYHSTGNLVLNCDFHHNQDPLTTGDNYGNGDGLSIAWIRKTDDVNYVRGCRFYWNTDDGIDLYMNDGTVEIENCQAFYNGYVPDTFTSAGDGNGFKLGTSNDYRNDVKRILKNCVAIKNKRHGFDINDELGIIKLYNCDAYLNGYSGIVLSTNNLVNYAYNCLSYANTNPNGLSTNGIYLNNSWQNNITVNNYDFVSLDLSLLLTPRQSNGELPITNLLRLASGSDLINAGVDVGIPYNGTAPDIGAYEKV